MTRLSVNLNKIATLRNARGGNNPNLLKVAQDCEAFGAQGITVHPRPDERHITYQDVLDLQPIITTEFNIEGYPDKRYLDLVKRVRPDQATLVPDPPSAITSNAGWNTVKNEDFLSKVISELKAEGIRTSIFVDTEIANIIGASEIGTDRIELYTEPYAANFHQNKDDAVMPFRLAADEADRLGLKLNAGHDLDLQNLKFLIGSIPTIKEVSIGHALISDALYYGLENTIQMYLHQLS